jgi:predicted TIM-barrel fold metal-dependent hydrolase
VPLSHILFGTDFPMWRGIDAAAKGLRDYGGFTASELRAVDRDNALALFPRFKT